jgi:23S rRNA (pseudouridine1915-N3)-methyltransferase
MFRIIAVTDSFGHFEGAVAEYQKRLGKTLELVKIKPEKSEDSKVVVRRESERIAEYLEKRKIRPTYLDFRGQEFASTEAFAEMLRKRLSSGMGADFLIGGAYGVDPVTVDPLLAGRIALSKLTFPHSLALLVLIEQLYRVTQIEKGSGYHH